MADVSMSIEEYETLKNRIGCLEKELSEVKSKIKEVHIKYYKATYSLNCKEDLYVCKPTSWREHEFVRIQNLNNVVYIDESFGDAVKHEYVNLDKVVHNIRSEEKRKLQRKIEEVEIENDKVEERIKIVKTTLEKKISEYIKLYENLEEKYISFVNNEDRLSLHERLIELQDKYETLEYSYQGMEARLEDDIKKILSKIPLRFKKKISKILDITKYLMTE